MLQSLRADGDERPREWEGTKVELEQSRRNLRLIARMRDAASSQPDPSISLVPATNAPPFHWLHTPFPCPCLPFSLCCERVVVCEEWLTQLPAPPRLLHTAALLSCDSCESTAVQVQPLLDRSCPSELAQSPSFPYLRESVYRATMSCYRLARTSYAPNHQRWQLLPMCLHLLSALAWLMLVFDWLPGATWATHGLYIVNMPNLLAAYMDLWLQRWRCQWQVHAVMAVLREANADLLEAYQRVLQSEQPAALTSGMRLAQWRWVTTTATWRQCWASEYQLCLVLVDEPPASEELQAVVLAV